MSLTNFDKARDYEKSRMHMADQIYQQLRYVFVERCDWNESRGRVLQRADIDVILEQNNQNLAISEKFRKQPHGDLLVEIYSKWDERIEGAALYSQADQLMYFNGTNEIYCIDANQLKIKALSWKSTLDKLTKEQKEEINYWSDFEVGFNDGPKFVRSFESDRIINGHQKLWRNLCVLVPWEQLSDITIHHWKIDDKGNIEEV